METNSSKKMTSFTNFPWGSENEAFMYYSYVNYFTHHPCSKANQGCTVQCEVPKEKHSKFLERWLYYLMLSENTGRKCTPAVTCRTLPASSTPHGVLLLSAPWTFDTSSKMINVQNDHVQKHTKNTIFDYCKRWKLRKRCIELTGPYRKGNGNCSLPYSTRSHTEPTCSFQGGRLFRAHQHNTLKTELEVKLMKTRECPKHLEKNRPQYSMGD